MSAVAVFHSLHVGGPLRLWDRCCLQSFADHGHEIIVFGYERFDVPRGVRWAPAQDIVADEERVDFFQKAPGAISRFSNLFRYLLLEKHGGWWVDTDVLCQSETVPDDDIVLGWEEQTAVGTGIMRMPVAYPLLPCAIDFSRANVTVDIWAYTGPQLLTKLVGEFGIADRVWPADRLYPLHWRAAFGLVDPAKRESIERIASQTPLLHLWHSIFRRAGFQTNFMPPAGSFLADAFFRHGGSGPALNPDAARRHIDLVLAMRYLHAQVQSLETEIGRLRG